MKENTFERCSPILDGFCHRARASAELNLQEAEAVADSNCESEIEKLFFCAMSLRMIAASRLFGQLDRPELTVLTWDNESAEAYQLVHGWSKSHTISIQHPIGKYRVDFIVMMMSENISSRKIVVECDGHDFHEKTKEQAQRDKERDRVLQSQGFNVFRFSGSEIWNDAWHCASQVYDVLIEDIRRGRTEKESISNNLVPNESNFVSVG